MISGTYGVIWYKYYDERNNYTPVMRGKKQRKKQNSGGRLMEHKELSGINIMTRGINIHQL